MLEGEPRTPSSSYFCTNAPISGRSTSIRFSDRGGQVQGGWVGPNSFGINYGSISCGQLSGYFVFCLLLIGGASPSYRYGAKYNVARKLANRNGAIIYAKAGLATF